MAVGCLASLVLYAMVLAFLIPRGWVAVLTAFLVVTGLLLANRLLSDDRPFI
jgi:hypothetical protein